MTPATIVKEAMADRVNLALSDTGNVRFTGEAAAVNRWLPIIREHKAGIVAVLQQAANEQAAAASWGWLIHFPDREPVEGTFSPMATHAEVLTQWPGAVAAEPMPTKPKRTASPDEAIELKRLIEAVYRDDTESDRGEALDMALADPEPALICYRAIALECGTTPTDPDDDRRTCRQCSSLTYGGVCSVAAPGAVVSAMRGYRPAPDLPQRCEAFEVKP